VSSNFFAASAPTIALARAFSGEHANAWPRHCRAQLWIHTGSAAWERRHERAPNPRSFLRPPTDATSSSALLFLSSRRTPSSLYVTQPSLEFGSIQTIIVLKTFNLLATEPNNKPREPRPGPSPCPKINNFTPSASLLQYLNPAAPLPLRLRG
jgi:hypothetical protein